MTSALKPFPFYYKELPTFQRVVASLIERDSIDVKNYEDAWFTVCSENNIFQIWNKEYIEALSKEILNLIGENLILEVAAGDGMLSHWLREHGVNIKATDNMSWHKSSESYNTVNRLSIPLQTYSEVEDLDAISAIRKYKPMMVIASWIPYGYELDCEILDEDPEYLVVIGEGDSGCTGSMKFWGDWTTVIITEGGLTADSDTMPAYWKQKKYSELELEVDKWNICRTDYGHKWGRHHGSTTLYTKGG